MKSTVYLIGFFHDCLWKQFFVFNIPQSPSNLNLWTISLTMRLFRQFQFKINAIKLQKELYFLLVDNYFTNLFSEVQIRYRKAFKFGPVQILETESKFQTKYDCF